MNKTIQQALDRGDLLDFSRLFATYPKTRQAKILRRARYLKAAITLRDLRKKLKLSQEKLALKMQVKREFISRVESGEQNITLETLYRIATATGTKFTFHFK